MAACENTVVMVLGASFKLKVMDSTSASVQVCDAAVVPPLSSTTATVKVSPTLNSDVPELIVSEYVTVNGSASTAEEADNKNDSAPSAPIYLPPSIKFYPIIRLGVVCKGCRVVRARGGMYLAVHCFSTLAHCKVPCPPATPLEKQLSNYQMSTTTFYNVTLNCFEHIESRLSIPRMKAASRGIPWALRTGKRVSCRPDPGREPCDTAP